MGRDSRRRWSLVLLCAVPAAAEAVVLYVCGFASAYALAPQAAAPPPFGAYHDLRWVLTFASSWWSFAWMMAVAVAARSAFVALGSVLAWPGDLPRPAPRRLLLRSAAATVLATAVLSPAATLAFASSAVSYSWFMLTSIVAVGALSTVLPSALVAGSWWRRLVAWRAMAVTVGVWAALMVEALAIGYAPGPLSVVVAAASGALNAVLWRRQVGLVVRAPAPRARRVPLSPVAVLAVLAAFLVGGGLVLGDAAGTPTNRALGPDRLLPRLDVSLLYVPGYDSSYDGSRLRMLGTSAWHYSYAGLDAAGGPAPYAPRRTHQPLAVSARLLARQVEALRRRGGRDVALLADSEGSLVVRTYLDHHRAAPVRLFVEVSPLVRPARVAFPPAGADGPGFAAGWEARGLIGLLRLENAGLPVSADQPFVRSVVAAAGRLRGGTMCPSPGVPVYAFVPFEGALTVYDRPVAHVWWTAVPGYHAHLLDDPVVQRDVARLVRTGRPRRHHVSTAVFDVLSAAAAAWQVPALPLALTPGGPVRGGTDAAFGGWRCPAAG